jgi:HAD superfamily hydrolase (TIGR01484 family)
MIKAAVLDLDGTLIGRDERVSHRVRDAVGSVSSRVPVSIATGREASDAIKFAKQLGLTAPQISDGGAAMLDPASGQPLWSHGLTPDQAQRIVTHLSDAGISFIATHPGGKVTQMKEVPHWHLTRVSALDLEESAAEEVLARFSAHPDLHAVKVYLPYNDFWAVDFTRSGVDKAAATQRLAQHLGTTTSAMVAVGDSYNDLAMLKVCGFKVAMGGAPPELKRLADYVAPPVEQDGLATAIEKFVLPRMKD